MSHGESNQYAKADRGKIEVSIVGDLAVLENRQIKERQDRQRHPDAKESNQAGTPRPKIESNDDDSDRQRRQNEISDIKRRNVRSVIEGTETDRPHRQSEIKQQ